MAALRRELDDGSIGIDLPDGALRLWPDAFEADQAAELFAELRQGIDWQQEEIVIFGARRPVPRLVAWHGDPSAHYTYSGTAHVPRPWTPRLQHIRERVEGLAGTPFNAVLLNLYRDGRDGMGWHADDEPELGPAPVIASVSLGATRRFCLRHRRRKDHKLDLSLAHGNLLLMAASTQRHWVHAVPKTTRPVGERINLTFRLVRPGWLR
ncbi:MAG: alpha-ketoglutarate-dependent dioxygenase AlkB [Steroidobacteraceae bacterium]